ncbi:hypothetical protein [Promicromonospora sp. NPDC023805]|uniref:hypothetical protein n=1 Tax=Promicromonospora sp. NPDC023805 TaxID=3154696 RepID=UPI0033E2BCF0
MPELVPHTVAPGTLAGIPRPAFPLGGGIELRPWADGDAQTVMSALHAGVHPHRRTHTSYPDLRRYRVAVTELDPQPCPATVGRALGQQSRKAPR